jgi:hypothetical protein
MTLRVTIQTVKETEKKRRKKGGLRRDGERPCGEPASVAIHDRNDVSNYVIGVRPRRTRRGGAGAQTGRRARLFVGRSCGGAKHVLGETTSHGPGRRNGPPAGDSVFETIPGIALPSLPLAPGGARGTVGESIDVFDKALRDRCAGRRWRSQS